MIERIVVKVGGATLFHRNGFEPAVCSLLSQNQHAQIWLLVGGGDLIEAIRTAHQIYPQLNDEEVHWQCIELLDYTWTIAKQIVPVEHSIATRENFRRATQICDVPCAYWVRVQAFYNREDSDQIPNMWLPKSDWNTTTDALAWLLGKIIDADRVILMKQSECNAAWTLDEAAHRGVIDSELARLVQANPGIRPTVELMRVDFSIDAKSV